MHWLVNLSIRTRLALITVLTCTIALLLASIIIIAYDNYAYRTQKAGEISAQAGILAARMVASLEFDDRQAAQEYLGAIAGNPEITVAAAYTSNGSLFASYSRSGIRPPPSSEPQGQRYEENEFIVFWPVQQGQQQVGSIYLRASTEPLGARIIRYGGIIFLVMIASLLVTLPIAMRLHYAIANPEYARSLIEASLDPLIIISPEGKVTDVNEATIRVTGISRAGLIGTDFSTYFTEPEKARAVYQQVFAQKSVTDYPLTIRHLDGKLTDVLYNASVYKDEHGNVLGVFAAARDVTAQKQAEEMLSNQTGILKSVLASIGEGVIVADLNGKFIIWNPAAEQIIGKGPTDGTQEHWTEQYGVFLPDQVTPYPAHQLPLARAIRGESMDGDEQFLRHDKKPQGVWLSMSGRPLRDESGVLQGGVVAISDITERKQVEESLKSSSLRLEAANKELEAFSYSVSHDLRAPLRSIDGFSQVLLEDYADRLDDQGKDHLNRVRVATQRMGHLIDDMLILSRITRAEMRRGTVNLSALAADVLEELQKSEPERKVDWHVEPGLVAQGDAQLLRVALVNLLSNAWKFTGKTANAKIEFGAMRNAPIQNTQGTMEFFVRDNGAGYNMAYADKLFGVFQRLHTTAEFPGTGIGLVTVQRIVHRHGGQVRAVGAPDQGATFYFTLSD